MFDFLRLILEYSLKAIPDVRKSRKDKELAKIGAQLYAVYFRVNEMLVSGHHLLKILEFYEDYQSRHAASKTVPREIEEVRAQIHDQAILQKIALGRLARLMSLLSLEFQVVDGESYRLLQLYIEDKWNVVINFIWALERDAFPFIEPTRERMENVPGRGMTLDVGGPLVNATHRYAVPLTEPWSDEVREAVTKYLRDRKPHEQLELIAAQLEQFRTALGENFSANELLLAVKSPEFYPVDRMASPPFSWL